MYRDIALCRIDAHAQVCNAPLEVVRFGGINGNALFGCIKVYAELRDRTLDIVDVRTKQTDVGCSLFYACGHFGLEFGQWVCSQRQQGYIHVPGIGKHEVTFPVPCAGHLDSLPVIGSVDTS